MRRIVKRPIGIGLKSCAGREIWLLFSGLRRLGNPHYPPGAAGAAWRKRISTYSADERPLPKGFRLSRLPDGRRSTERLRKLLGRRQRRKMGAIREERAVQRLQGRQVTAMREKLSFQIDGEFICSTARSWFWESGQPYEKCERLLLGSLITDQLTLAERKNIVIEILEGRKKLVGINTFQLMEDGANIRPLTLKFQQYEREDMIRRIEADMEARPLAYVDRYAAPRALEDYEVIQHWQRGEEPEPGGVLTQADQVRMYLYAQTNIIGAARLEPGYYAGEMPLDREMYLLDHPDWVYDYIGAPVSDENESALYQKLFEFWEEKSKEDLPSSQLTLQHTTILCDGFN